MCEQTPDSLLVYTGERPATAAAQLSLLGSGVQRIGCSDHEDQQGPPTEVTDGRPSRVAVSQEGFE